MGPWKDIERIIDNIYKRWKDIKEYVDSRIQFSSIIDKEMTDSDLSALDSKINKKQDKLKAGDNITIKNNVISAKGGETYEAGQNIDIANNTISAKGYTYDESNKSFGEVLGTGTGMFSHTEGASYLPDMYVRKLTQKERDTVFNNTGVWYDYAEIDDNIPDESTGFILLQGNYYRIIKSEYVDYISGDLDVFNTETPLPLEDGTTYFAEGYFNNNSSGDHSHTEGNGTTAKGNYSHAEGVNTVTNGAASHAECSTTTAGGEHSHAEGYYTTTQNHTEHAEGRYNVSHLTSSTYGNAGNTQHSIGIGNENNRKNAFEIMQNGDVYINGLGTYDGTNPSSADSLQDVINNIIATEKVNISIVSSLPAVGDSNTIYFVPSSGTNNYDEYIYENGTWIQTRTVTIDVSSKQDKTVIVDLTSGSTITQSLDPNKLYMFGEKTDITITLNTGDTGIVNEYMFQFTSGNVATTLNVPNTVVWLKEPDIQTNKIYQVSIENNLGIIGEWSNE